LVPGCRSHRLLPPSWSFVAGSSYAFNISLVEGEGNRKTVLLTLGVCPKHRHKDGRRSRRHKRESSNEGHLSRSLLFLLPLVLGPLRPTPNLYVGGLRHGQRRTHAMGEVPVVRVVVQARRPQPVLGSPNETGGFHEVFHRLIQYGPFSAHAPILREERGFPIDRRAILRITPLGSSVNRGNPPLALGANSFYRFYMLCTS
jgi:hypothetical protein